MNEEDKKVRARLLDGSPLLPETFNLVFVTDHDKKFYEVARRTSSTVPRVGDLFQLVADGDIDRVEHVIVRLDPAEVIVWLGSSSLYRRSGP